jgi:signal transduction histidine kinase/FixJ family two-component response regulator/putative methionine-R-sulfoxide reductase with GAF domain
MTAAPEKIIIIDDEKRMCDSLTALLEGEGYQVESFQQSPQAVEVIRGGKVDLVITDIKMPQMDGLEILRVVKEVDEDIPVILMTGYASLDTAVDAIARGAYDYLMKPVEFTSLELAVKRALEKRRSGLARLRLLEELKLSNLILQRRIGELNALYEAGKSIGSSANLAELLRQLVVLASTVTEAKTGSIMLLDERKEFLTIEAAIGLDREVIKNTRLPIGASIAGYVAKTGEAIIVDDVESDDRFKRINRERYQTTSLLCTPLRIKNNILGVINMSNKENNQQFTSDDLRLLTTFASQAAVAVDDAYQFEKNRRRLIEFQILHEISGELPSIDSWTAFGDMLVKKLSRLFSVEYALLFFWDKNMNMLLPEGVAGKTDIPLTESGKIDLRKIDRTSISLSNIDLGEFDFEDIPRLSLLLGEKLGGNENFPAPNNAYMAIPILKNGELAYIFYLGSGRDKAYSDDDISLAKLIVSQATLLFEKEKAILNATRLLTMGNMISEISHDLRKPLTSIKGGLQIIKQRIPKDINGSEFFKMVEDEIHRMNELVRELVDFSNPNKYETEKADLQQLVKRTSELVRPDLRKQNITFESEFEQINWEMIINKNQILEVFLNLFINAIGAMPDGGTLTVRGLVEKPEHKDKDFMAIKVIDTGVGIKKENLTRIFERYYTTKESGTGLGLSVVERILSAHGWICRVESAEGKGTTFSIYIPLDN